MLNIGVSKWRKREKKQSTNLYTCCARTKCIVLRIRFVEINIVFVIYMLQVLIYVCACELRFSFLLFIFECIYEKNSSVLWICVSLFLVLFFPPSFCFWRTEIREQERGEANSAQKDLRETYYYYHLMRYLPAEGQFTKKNTHITTESIHLMQKANGNNKKPTFKSMWNKRERQKQPNQFQDIYERCTVSVNKNSIFLIVFDAYVWIGTKSDGISFVIRTGVVVFLLVFSWFSYWVFSFLTKKTLEFDSIPMHLFSW